MLGQPASCEAILQGGQRCRATPMRDVAFCFFHNPETAQDVAEARRLGGLRRRREGTLAGAYELDGLGTVADLRRLLEVAAFDALGLENSVARVRAITSIVQVGARLLEVGELEARIETLEAAIQPRIAAARQR